MIYCDVYGLIMLYDIIKGYDEIFVLILISFCKIYIVFDNVVISIILIIY